MSEAVPTRSNRLARCSLPLASLVSLAGCAGLPGRNTPPQTSGEPPAVRAASAPHESAATPGVQRVPGQQPRPRIGLALGGGAARGFAHDVGVIEVLERAGFRPDVVVGTSAGSLVGALYASGMSPQELRSAAMSLEEGALGDWSLRVRGVLRGQALQDLVNRLVGRRSIERFAIPFAAVACDLYDGRAVHFRRGDAGLAVRASSAVPGVFEPVAIQGREYVDGGLVSPVPVRAARALGAEYVIAVDIASKPKFQETDTMPRVLLQTFTIMSQHLASTELREADLLLAPAVGDLSSADFSQRTVAITEGERAALAALPKLRGAFPQANREAQPRRG